MKLISKRIIEWIDFRNKVYEQNSNYQAEIDILEEKVRDLTEKVF